MPWFTRSLYCIIKEFPTIHAIQETGTFNLNVRIDCRIESHTEGNSIFLKTKVLVNQ